MPTPMKSCVTPKDKPNSPANAPSDSADSPKSVRSPSAMMEVTVRKAWLSEKADSKVSSMAQSNVDEDAAGRPVGEGVGGTGMAESAGNKPGPEGPAHGVWAIGQQGRERLVTCACHYRGLCPPLHGALSLGATPWRVAVA